MGLDYTVCVCAAFSLRLFFFTCFLCLIYVLFFIYISVICLQFACWVPGVVKLKTQA